jgi:Transglycosylase SLT domain
VANLGSNFYSKLVQLAAETGMRPEDILAVMVSESGINPAAHNPHGGATGLMQFMPSSLKGVGYQGSSSDFGALSGEEQLPYIKKLIEGNMRLNGGPFTNAAQYYVAVFWPVGLKLPGVHHGNPDTPLVEENPESVNGYSKKYYDLGIKIPVGQESAAYKANPIFHGAVPGIITYGDMMHQVDKNKRNPLYSKALMSMNEQTGYQPGATAPASMIATRTQPQSQQSSSFMDVLDRFVQSFSATAAEQPNKKLYKKMLPSHDILIQISAPDYTTAVEFSRILCAALDEEVQATAYPHTDGSQIVDVECSIAGPALGCLEAVDQLSQSLSDAFKDATKKIGGIVVKTHCVMNKKSFYQQISLRTAETNYRKFLLKFI